jgi:hypothetical protein
MGHNIEAKVQLARKRRILNLGCAAYFSGITRRASGRIRCPPGGWLAGLGPFNFRKWRVIQALWLDCTKVPTTRGCGTRATLR